MTESFFDRVDAAYAEKGKPANDADKPFSDDVCPCRVCRSDMAGIVPCMNEGGGNVQ